MVSEEVKEPSTKDNISLEFKIFKTGKAQITIRERESLTSTRPKLSKITADSELDGAKSSTSTETLALSESTSKETCQLELWAHKSELCSTHSLHDFLNHYSQLFSLRSRMP